MQGLEANLVEILDFGIGICHWPSGEALDGAKGLCHHQGVNKGDFRN